MQAYDLLIVGGGINGAAVARDAAGRGLSVCLVEAGDPAGATSGASSKLIHGGLRYLEQYAFGLVRESLRERAIMLKIAPHLTRPCRFVLPLRSGMRPAWLMQLGLWLYDNLGGQDALPDATRIRLDDGSDWAAPLKPGLKEGFLYFDVQVDDARLVILTLRDAEARGADVLTRHPLPRRPSRHGQRRPLAMPPAAGRRDADDANHRRPRHRQCRRPLGQPRTGYAQRSARTAAPRRATGARQPYRGAASL